MSLKREKEAEMNPEHQENRTFRGMKRITFIATVFLLTLLTGMLYRQLSQPVDGQPRSTLWVSSTSFTSGGEIPSQYTCEGADVSPQLGWQAAPAGTKSLAVVMHDPDAPADFTHWVVWNIAPGARELAVGASGRGGMPPGAREGSNDFGHPGYGGPCPPPGKPHRYNFRVYALDILVNLPAGATRRELEAAMSGHLIAVGQLVGIYRRAGQ